MIRKPFFQILLICLWPWVVNAQTINSPNTLSFSQYLQIVRTYHPVIREAAIEVEMAQGEILKANGAFNPIISAEMGQKVLGGTQYYSYTNPTVKWPVWFGAEIEAGTERWQGDRLEVGQTKGDISYIGVSVPLLKDLLLDKRRAYLQQARVMHSMAKSQRQIWVNDIMFEAIETYIKWLEAYQSLQAIQQLVNVNQERVRQIKAIWQSGERAAIDTTEAYTQWQSMLLMQNDYEVKWIQAGYALSAFLWKEKNEPQGLPDEVIPDSNAWSFDETALEGLVTELLHQIDDRHPYLQWYQQKINWQRIDKRLKFQELLPKLNVQYNQLSKSAAFSGIGNMNQFLDNNYKYGIKFETPLLFSNGRASYRIATLKLEQLQLNEAQKKMELQVKLKQYFASYSNLKKQLAIQSGQVENFRKLVQAEENRFSQGESSLFLMNSRENKLIENIIKQVELNAKKLKSAYSILWAAGTLQ